MWLKSFEDLTLKREERSNDGELCLIVIFISLLDLKIFFVLFICLFLDKKKLFSFREGKRNFLLLSSS